MASRLGGKFPRISNTKFRHYPLLEFLDTCIGLYYYARPQQQHRRSGGTFMLGRTVSHYHITSQLGEGGMGIVYEAEDTNLGRHVALKFLTPAKVGHHSLSQRFQRDAR